MDEKNIDLLIKKRTEEIRDQREKENNDETLISDEMAMAHQDVGTPRENTHCVDDENVRQTISTIRKVQKRSILWKLFALALVIGLNVLWFSNMGLKTQIKDLKLEVLSLLEGGEVYTYKGQPMAAEDLLFLDNRILINADFVIESIDPEIHYSNSGTRVYIPLLNVPYELETISLTEYVKKNIVDVNIPILTRNDINYIDFEVLSKLYNLKVMSALDGSFAIYDESYDQLFMVKNTIEFVKTSHGMKIITEEETSYIKSIVLDVHEDLSKIMTENGRIGYVNTKDLEPYTSDYKNEALNEVRKEHDYGEHINMTWSQIGAFKNNPDLSVQEDIPGLDVIAPTWFSLNINGIVINEADFRYVMDAHEKNYEVWGLFSNSFKPNWTSDMLNDEIYRKKAIAQIVFFAALYDLDGVNIDYENMYLEDQDKFTQFVAELYSLLKEQNVVLSLATTVPGGSDQWSLVYDRENLAKHVDYITLMAYDEFWASSSVSGPVASIPWVEKGIKESLELIPNEKLILGIPLYMRVWIESGASVSSKAFGIKHLDGILEEQDYTESYDEDNFVNYIAYHSDDKLYRIWVEDAISLEKRITLMKKYKLPGIGTWSAEFVESDTWLLLEKYLD